MSADPLPFIGRLWRDEAGLVEIRGNWPERIEVSEGMLGYFERSGQLDAPGAPAYDGLHLSIDVSNGSALYIRQAPPAQAQPIARFHLHSWHLDLPAA